MSAQPQSAAAARRDLDRLAVADAARRVHHDLEHPAEPRAGGGLVVGGAAALFVAIFALRLAIDDPPALIANFYTIPTALLAVAYGVRAGVAGALVSTALVFLWHLVEPVEVSVLGYVSRIAVVLVVGTLVGHYAERLRADIARRHEAERELAVRADDLARSNARLEQAVQHLAAMATIARAVGAETDLHRSLALIVEAGRELAGGAELAVWVPNGDGLARAAASGPLPAREAARVPLRYRGEPLGELSVHADGSGASPDPDLLAAIAASAATAIATARSVAADRVRDAIAASEHERRRWAWELHDQTLQGLVGIRVLLSSALRSSDPGALDRAAAGALDDLQVEISNLKHLIAELRPAALDELGLEPALSDLCERVAATSGIAISRDLALNGAGLSREAESTIYRVAQEALTNLAKHSAAEHAALTVRRAGDHVEMQISDDGRGFEPLARHDGFGLRGMRERVELAGGRLDVRADRGGTCVQAVLPAACSPAGLSETAAPVRTR